MKAPCSEILNWQHIFLTLRPCVNYKGQHWLWRKYEEGFSMIRTLPDSNAFSLAYLPSYPCICLYLYILLRKQRLGVIKGNKYANARSTSQYLVCILIVCRAKKHNKRTQQLESKEYFFIKYQMKYQISNEIYFIYEVFGLQSNSLRSGKT